MPLDLRERWRGPTTWPILLAAVAGDSMLPVLADGDFVVVLRKGRLRPGRVAAVRDPRDPDRILVKRVHRREAAGWWVLGDNPVASTDSRQFGAVADDLVVGRVLFRYWRSRR